MKQVVLNYKTGKLRVDEVPLPSLNRSQILVRNAYSLISAGTERASIEVAKASLIQKAKQRPDQVRQVLHNLKQEGLFTTIRKVQNRLDTEVSLGYCSAGTVIDAGENVKEFKKGDRVVCTGDKYANHADVISVPQGICLSIPANVSNEEAVFAPVGAIALNGVRQAKISLGDKVAVIGLGLIGQLVVQVLKAAGCTVVGIDISKEKLAVAKKLGCDETLLSGSVSDENLARHFGKHGADAVIITASASTPEPLETAGKLCRENGKVVLIGAVPISIPRKEYYEKEIQFVVARAFGPGSYDKEYLGGQDYPQSYVKWTAKRNMQEFLQLIAEKKLNVKALITHRYHVEDASKAYDFLERPTGLVFGVVFIYGKETPKEAIVFNTDTSTARKKANLKIGFIGAGNFAQGYLLPSVLNSGVASLQGVATSKPVTANNALRKFGFGYATCDYSQILKDKQTDIVFVATRHDMHAKLAAETLKAGKALFVEKPLAMNRKELRDVVTAYNKTKHPYLMIGFNRRFSPFTQEMKAFFQGRIEPMSIHYRVNAEPLPKDHWVYDQSEGGGRLLGEMAHFIDFMQFMCDSVPTSVYAIGNQHGRDEDLQVILQFADGSTGSITYVTSGDRMYPREYVEIYSGGKIGVIHNFKKSERIVNGRRKTSSRFQRDMGHKAEVAAVIESAKEGKQSPIPFDQIVLATLATFAIEDSKRQGVPKQVDVRELL